MIALSTRTCQILEYLLRMDQPISMNQIALRFDLSPPMVRHSLRYIESWLHERGHVLTKKRRVGVSIDADSVTRERLLDELASLPSSSVALNPEERHLRLLLSLLIAEQPVRLDGLQKDLGLSRTTLFRDLRKVRQRLKEQGLCMRSSRHIGLRIEGPEWNWRDMVVELLVSEFSEGLLVAACVEPRLMLTRDTMLSGVSLLAPIDFLERLQLWRAERLIASLENSLQMKLVDAGRVFLDLHLGLLLMRVHAGHIVSPQGKDVNSRLIPREQEVAQELALQITQLESLILTPGEIAFLAVKITEAISKGYIDKRVVRPSNKDVDQRAIWLTQRLLAEASRYIHPSLEFDEELAECVRLEIESSLRTAMLSIGRHNLLLTETGDALLALFDLTERIVRPLFEGLGYKIGDRNVASLALHLETALERLNQSVARRRVIVVCGAGVATARMLVSRLTLRVPELEIVATISAFEMTSNPHLASGIDAIVSTVPLQAKFHVPVIVVTPVLKPDEIRGLRTQLGLRADSVAGGMSISRIEPMLSLTDVLLAEAIEVGVLAETWEEVVNEAGRLLLDTGAIWPSYIEAMKDMIRTYGPYVVVVPGAALLHAGPELGVKRLAMSLITLALPVPFGHQSHDPVKVAIAFSSVDRHSHVRVLQELMALLCKQDILDRIANAREVTQVLEVLSEEAREPRCCTGHEPEAKHALDTNG